MAIFSPAADRVGDPAGGLVHVGQHRRIGGQRPQRRRQKARRVVNPDTATGKHAGDDVVDLMALGDRQGHVGPCPVQPLDPVAARQRALDAKERAVGRPGLRVPGGTSRGQICHAPT